MSLPLKSAKLLKTCYNEDMPEQPQHDPFAHLRVRGDLKFQQEGKKNCHGLVVNELRQEIKKDELIRLLLAGRTCREAATILRLNVSTVRKYAREVAFQEELRLLSHDVWLRVDEELKMSLISYTQRIDELADRALANIASLMESTDERVALRANQDILDRHPETSKHHHVDNTTTVMVLDPSQLALAAKAAMEIEAKTIDGGEVIA